MESEIQDIISDTLPTFAISTSHQCEAIISYQVKCMSSGTLEYNCHVQTVTAGPSYSLLPNKQKTILCHCESMRLLWEQAFILTYIYRCCLDKEWGTLCTRKTEKVAKQILVLGIIINILHIHFMYMYVNICLCSSFDYMCFSDVCLFRVTLTSVSSIYIHQFKAKNSHLKLSTTDRWYLLPCHHTQITEFLNLCCLHWRKVGVKTSP